MRRSAFFPVGVLLLLPLSGCLSDMPDMASSAGGASDHPHAGGRSSDDTLGEPTLRIELLAGSPDQELRFIPEAVTVHQGDIVEVTIRNMGQAPHTWTIHELDLDTGVLDPGEWTTVNFRADREGIFESMCDVAGHYEAGMKGTLQVSA